MSDREPQASSQSARSLDRTVRLRLIGAVVALAAGTAAVVIAILLVRSALS